MNRYEEDGMEELGWLTALLGAVVFLCVALVVFAAWVGWLS